MSDGSDMSDRPHVFDRSDRPHMFDRSDRSYRSYLDLIDLI